MKVEPIRYCIECGKRHNSGIEDRIEGTFEPIDTCIDCLMGKCSFNFQKTNITLDETQEMTYDDYHRVLGETLLQILDKTYWKQDEVRDLPES